MTVPRVLQEALQIVDDYDAAHPETAPTRPRVATKWPLLRPRQHYCYCGHLAQHHEPAGCRILIDAKRACPCDAFSENSLDEFPEL